MEEFALCCVELEDNFKTIFDEWSFLEIYEDKSQLLQNGRNLSEILHFAEISLQPLQQFQQHFDKIVFNWKTSLPKPTDSLINWSDLIAYRNEFCRLAKEKGGENTALAEKSLVDIEMDLLSIAFIQRKSDAAHQFIKKLQSISTNENILKLNLSIGKYDLIQAENKLNIGAFKVGIKKMGKSWQKIKEGVLDFNAAEDFKEIQIEALCFASDISMKLATIYQKIDPDDDILSDDVNKGFRFLCKTATAADDNSMDIDDDVDVNMVNEFLRYSEASLNQAKAIAQEYLENEFSSDRENLVGNVHFKLGQFYRKMFIINNENQVIFLT